MVCLVVMAYVVCRDEQEAERIGLALVEKRLAACVNFFPCKSIFKWKGKMEKCCEVVLFVKTVKEKIPVIEEEVKRLHSYEVPCVCFYESIGGLAGYEKFVSESVGLKG